MSDFVFPKFTDAGKFESLVRDIFKKRTRNINFQIYGRKGQEQYGIDSYGQDYSMNEFIVVQCKNYTKEKEKKDLLKEIKKALELFDKKELPFFDKVKRFYFVSALDRDKNLSDKEVGELNSGREIPVKILTWDDLMDDLDEHEDLLYKYYTKVLPHEKQENLFLDVQKSMNLSFDYRDDIFVHKDEILDKFKSKIVFDSGLGINKVNSSTIAIGLWGFGDKPPFEEGVDIDISFCDYFSSSGEDSWNNAIICIKRLGKILNRLAKSVCLKRVIIYQHIQPCLALLVGRILRKATTGLEFVFYMTNNGKAVFLSNENHNFLHVAPAIQMQKIYHAPRGSKNDIIFLFNNSQPQSLSVDFISKKPVFEKINPMYGFGLFGDKIMSTSHGISQAEMIIQQIGDIIANYKDPSEQLNIHLIIVAPEQFAALIGSKIQTIAANIHLYYQSKDHTDYIKAGELPSIS